MSGPSKLTHQRGVSPELERAQSFVRRSVDPVIDSEILGGKLLNFDTDSTGRRTDGVAFAAGVPRKVPHKLSRKPRGWMVVRDFGANPHELLETAANTDASFLYLESTVACTVYLWVF
jgi:hypothetical protein